MSNPSSPNYINALQHRRIERALQSQSFNEDSSLNPDNSISTPNATKIAIEVFEENQRLLAQIEQMRRNHLVELRKMRDEYDLRILKLSENEEKFTKLLIEKDATIETLKEQISFSNKDKIISQLNDQMAKINQQYESAINSHSLQLERFQTMVEKVEFLSRENHDLKNQISFINNRSPENAKFPQNSPNRSQNIETPKKTVNNDLFNMNSSLSEIYDKYSCGENSNNKYNNNNNNNNSTNNNNNSTNNNNNNNRYNNNNISPSSFSNSDRININYLYDMNKNSNIYNNKAATPPVSYTGRRRAPPDHPALAEQIIIGDQKAKFVIDRYYDNQKNEFNNANKADLRYNFTLKEIKTALEALNKEKMELEREIRRALPVETGNFTIAKKIQREKDEDHLDDVEKMIGRLRLELLKAGELNT